jgi:hypothetical protein
VVGYREHANMKSCRTIRPNCAGQPHRWSDQTPRPLKMKLITRMRKDRGKPCRTTRRSSAAHTCRHPTRVCNSCWLRLRSPEVL